MYDMLRARHLGSSLEGVQSDIWISVTRVSQRRREEREKKCRQRLTFELEVFTHKVLDETGREHEVVYSLRRAGQHGLQRDLGVMFAFPPARALCDFVHGRRGCASGHGGGGGGGNGPGQEDVLLGANVGALELADVVDDVIDGVAGEEGRKVVFRGARRDLERVGDDERRHLLFEGDNLVDGNDDVRDPAEDVGVEAYVMLGDVQPALDEDLALQRAPVVCELRRVSRKQTR
jgi:hypothetical protein